MHIYFGASSAILERPKKHEIPPFDRHVTLTPDDAGALDTTTDKQLGDIFSKTMPLEPLPPNDTSLLDQTRHKKLGTIFTKRTSPLKSLEALTQADIEALDAQLEEYLSPKQTAQAQPRPKAPEATGRGFSGTLHGRSLAGMLDSPKKYLSGLFSRVRRPL